MKDGDGKYINNMSVSKIERLAYYKAVLHYLENINRLPHIEEELSIPEYRMAIANLIGIVEG